ncbi:uncharacterized protein FTJAE_12525 [Fusarium tjaetaba]|uniref:Uncharacterized protein n=1 Tax=Fusarium tjaetaba TaxID=1567544 RepID=A0A8H5VD71_9HYPO|nr:uncharacterized protein FTJAE_12525 [Fusarium tjaetaba]KAF5617735.1 hypothetical protein FTJAE_12525 [Fusarium tjaetaba]
MSEPRGSKRVYPHQGQKESTRTKKRPETRAKIPISESARAIARSCLEARRPIVRKDLEDTFRPVDFANEKPEIEGPAMKLYDASHEKEDYDEFNPEVNSPVVKDFKALWKVGLRLWGVSPTTVISPMVGLRYFPLSSGRKRANHAVLSPDFSKLFAALITHPCWEFEHERFVLALQYLVRCRGDSRSPWPHQGAKERECPAIEALFNMFDETGYGDRSLHEMHKSARESIVGGNISVFSDFLYSIGERVTKHDMDQEQAYYDMPALPVTLGDMKSLTDAVKSFEWPDESWRCSPGDTYTAFKAERTSGKTDLPTTGTELKEFLDRSLKDIFRDIEIYRQEAGSERSSPVYQADKEDVLVDNAADADACQLPGPETTADQEMGVPEDDQHVPPESNPVRPQRRYRALVDGEESEDEQADLARSQGNRETAARSSPHSRYSWGDRNLSATHVESPYERFEIPRREAWRPSPQQATPGPSGSTMSQVHPRPIDSLLERRVHGLEKGQQRLESSFKEMIASHSRDINELRHEMKQSRTHTIQRYSGGVSGAVGIEHSDTGQKIRDLESQLAQAARDKEELSEKVASSEQENERLSAQISGLYRDNKGMSEKIGCYELRIRSLSRQLAEKGEINRVDRDRLSEQLVARDKAITSGSRGHQPSGLI